LVQSKGPGNRLYHDTSQYMKRHPKATYHYSGSVIQDTEYENRHILIHFFVCEKRYL